MKLTSTLYFFPLFLFQFLNETRGNEIRVVFFKHENLTGFEMKRLSVLDTNHTCLDLDDSEKKASSVKLVEGSCVLLCSISCKHRRHVPGNCFELKSEVIKHYLQQYNDQLQSIRLCDYERFRSRYSMVEDELEGSSRDERQRPGPGPGQERELREGKQIRRHYYSHKVHVPLKHSDYLSNFQRKRRHGKLDRYLYKHKY